MNMRSFAEGFDKDPIDYGSLSRREWQGATRSLMEPAQRWSNYFSHLLNAYFMSEPLEGEEVSRSLQAYTSDSNQQLTHNVVRNIERIAFHHPSIVSYTNKLNFHTINQEMIPYWKYLMEPEVHAAPDYIDISVMQARLGVRALQLARTRQIFYEQTLLAAPEPTDDELQLDQAFAGRITELEAPIAALEVLKQQMSDTRENLVLIPGPSRFESGRGKDSRASDFLLLDTEESQVAGIQVKTNLRGKSKYDQRFITFIDGVKHLGNTVEAHRTDGTATRKAYPGLLAADFILNDEMLQRQSAYSRIEGLQGMFGHILDAKSFACTLPEPADGLDQRTTRAAERLRVRLFDALYKNDSESDDADSEEE